MNMRRSLPRAVLILLLAAMTGWAIFHRDQVNLGQLRRGMERWNESGLPVVERIVPS